MEAMFFGKSWREQWSLTNPVHTHNYLELTYSIEEMMENKQAFEAKLLRKATFFNNYYVSDRY